MFFTKGEKLSVALIDISSLSVGGGVAHLEKGKPPVLYYTNRISIESHEGEETSSAMIRTLNELCDILVKKGGPILHQETGSGHVDRILVSVSAPWQATTIRVESLSALKPFAFTHALMAQTVQKNDIVPDGYIKSGESVIATLLNGYDMAHPFGKKASRADLIILSSLIEKKVAEGIETTLRQTYHTHALSITAFAPLSYTVFRDVYPHEKDFLVLDVSGEATDIAFVKQNLLVNVASMPKGINELMPSIEASTHVSSTRQQHRSEGVQIEWLSLFSDTLKEFSTEHALPRTLFLLANPDSRDFLKNLLDSPSLRSLWLTDEPLAIIPVVPSHFNAYVKTRGEAESDAYLTLLTLYANKTQLSQNGG